MTTLSRAELGGGKRCSVCQHPAVRAIDAALIAGSPVRGIAALHGLAKSAVDRHRMHARETIGALAVKRVQDRGESILTEILAIRDKASALGERAEVAGDLKTALMACRELTRSTELLARLSLESRSGVAEDVSNHPAWLRLSQSIMTALAPYPEAAAAVCAAIAQDLGVVTPVVSPDPGGTPLPPPE